jgi:hypothetical protein
VEFAVADEQPYPVRLVVQPAVFADALPRGGIRARLLRSIPLGALVDEYWAEYRRGLAGQRLFFGRSPSVQLRPPPRRNRGGPTGWGEAFYQDVAVEYLQALEADPKRPIAWMARRRRTSTTTVRDWVALARHKGYLTATTRGRAGGQPTPELAAALRAREADSADRRPRRNR